jgi:hypothetical protein
MTARRDPDRLIEAYFDDGPTQLPDRSYDAVRSEIDHTRQRVVFGPWRNPRVSKVTRFAIAAAVIAVIAVVGINLLPGSGGIGGPPAPSPSPSPSPSRTPAPAQLPTTPGEALAAGTYYIESRGQTAVTRLTFSLPAGWVKPEADFLVGKDEGTPGEVMVGTWIVSHIFTDACQWDEASIVDVGTTADQLMSALADQKSRTASAVTDTTVGGFPAKRIELTVSPTLDTATCTSGNLRYWPSTGRPVPDFSGGMCCNPTGNIDAIYAVDVAGNRVVIVARHYPGSNSQNLTELQSIVDSIQLEP